MKSDDPLDAKIARINDRMEARRAETRARLEAYPDLLALATELRETFGASIKYMKLGKVEQGDLGVYAQPGCVWTVYLKPKQPRA